MSKHRLKLPKKGVFLSLLCLLLGTALFITALQRPALAANPTTINFQGKVVNADGTNVASTTYSFTFRLYNNSGTNPNSTTCALEATCLWEETQGTVSVTNGVFQVELGSSCLFFVSNACNKSAPIDFNSSSALYLTMKFNSDANGYMTPLMHFNSVPYAFNADKLGGLSSSGFIQNTTSPQSSSNFNISGAGVIGTSLQTPAIITAAATDLALQPATGIVALNKVSTNNELRVYENAASPSNYASITATASDATFKSNTGITKIGNGTGAITLNAGAGTAINITGHTNSLWQTDAGTLTIQGGSTLSLVSTTSSTISLDSGTTGAVQIGTGANNKAISIGSTQTGTTLSLQGGTTANTAISLGTSGAGGITIDTGTTGNINIGNNANAKAVAIGNNTNGTTVTQTAGAVTNTLSNTGNIVKTNTNSATAFQVLNSSNLAAITVDTSASNANNLVTNSSFESATTGWIAKATGTCTGGILQDSTTSYNGSSSAKCAAAAANSGISYALTLSSATSYTINLYVKSSINMSTLEIGRSENGTTPADISCLTAQAVTSLGWKKLSCSFITGTVVGSAHFIYVKQTDATSRTLWVDAVLFQTDANADSNYRDAKISFENTVISDPIILQSTNNSSTALQIQNAAGIQVFNIDTASDNNLAAQNPGFEVNTTNWAIKGSASALQRDTSKSYVGIASGKFTTTSTSGDGVRYTFPSQLPASFYAISVYVQTSAADATFNIGYHNGSDTNCASTLPAASATVPTSTGWTRFICVTASSAVLNSIYITSGTTAITSFWVDALKVEAVSGSTSLASAYGAANITLNGIFSSPVAIRVPNDTTTSFLVQSSTSINLLSVDSLNKQVIIGSPSHTTNATILVLDNYNNATDPTGINGAMYYNASTSRFRCFEFSAWSNCTGLLGSNTAASANIASCTAACASYSNAAAAVPANYCQAGRTIHLIARGIYVTSAQTFALGVYYGTDAATKTNDSLIGAAMTTASITATTWQWTLDFTIVCFSTTVMNGGGTLVLQTNVTASTANTVISSITTAGGTTGLTTSSAKNLYIFPAYGASAAGNNSTLHEFIVTSN